MLKFYAKAALNNMKYMGNKIVYKRKEFDSYINNQKYKENIKNSNSFYNKNDNNGKSNYNDDKNHNNKDEFEFKDIKKNPFYWSHICVTKIKSITKSIFNFFKSDKMLEYNDDSNKNISENETKKNTKISSVKVALNKLINVKNKVSDFLVLINTKYLIQSVTKSFPLLIKNTTYYLVKISSASMNYLVSLKKQIDNKYQNKEVQKTFNESSKNLNDAIIKFSEKLVPFTQKLKNYSFVDKMFNKVKNNIGLSSKISRMNKVIQAKGAQKQFRIYYEHFKDSIKNNSLFKKFSIKNTFNLTKNLKYKLIALFLIYVFYKIVYMYLKYYRVNEYGINTQLNEIRELTKTLKEQNEDIIKSNYNLQYMLELEKEKNKKLLEKYKK